MRVALELVMIVTYDVTEGSIALFGDDTGSMQSLTAPSVAMEMKISAEIQRAEALYRVLMTLFRRHALATALVLHIVTTCIQRLVTNIATLSRLADPTDPLVGTCSVYTNFFFHR